MVERGPEKAGVGGSIPSLATILQFPSVPTHLIIPLNPYFSVNLSAFRSHAVP